jgi:DNA repair exonuclease SbcCD ATPase subunit
MELREAVEAAELSMLQLHQVQEDLEQYFFADGEKQLKLEARDRELDELRRSQAVQETALVQELQTSREHLEQRLAELEYRLTSKEIEFQEVTEAAELSLLQLHQVQEELENYFLKARASEQLAQAQFEQLQRAQGLMLRLHPDVLPIGPYSPSLAVQVLPELAVATPNPTLQAEALLNTYAASLQRASDLLERSRRP